MNTSKRRHQKCVKASKVAGEDGSGIKKADRVGKAFDTAQQYISVHSERSVEGREKERG